MANILYWSVHEALEYDDIILFQGMGHSVFSLGAYSPLADGRNPFRPDIAKSVQASVAVQVFNESGCRFSFNRTPDTELSQQFFDLFDVIIVVHDVHFIGKNWDKIRHKKVIWRTIGQAVRFYDRLMLPYRAEGLNIVRWSPRELLTDDYAGHDAIIRGYKDERVYKGWSGYLSKKFITFVSAYKARYETEYQFFEAATQDCSFMIGGGSNEMLKGSIGLIPHDQQIEQLRSAFGYLYFHAAEIPYTLNFIEAWMTGMPMIVLDRAAEGIAVDRVFNEVNDIIIDGRNGFKVKTPQGARDLIRHLLSNPDIAADVGRRGRLSAIHIFGIERARREWSNLFQALLM